VALLLLLAATPGMRAGEVIDRIVATVDHHAILLSEWDEAVRFECLLNGRALESVTPEDRRKVLDRLIDQGLLEQQMHITSSFVPVPESEVTKHIQAIRAQVPAWKSDEGWQAALDAYGLTPQDVTDHVTAQLNVLRFFDERFRPNIRIDRKAIENYYLEQFVPQLHRAGAPEIPLREVAPKIEELLVQKRIDELETAWLRNLRLQVEVQVR